jgi:hypothetical protein
MTTFALNEFGEIILANIDNQSTNTEPDADSNQSTADTGSNTESDNADKGEKPFTAEELQAFEKQEILDLIKAIEADYEVSISNITKDKLVQKYLEITAQ